MTGWVLPIFPGAGFESSLITAVLIGVLVALVFHETVGWGFTGLVVPGYLASILLVRPSAGVVVLVEALVTFAAVRLYARVVSRWLPQAPLLGRDRFFALLLTGVAVRLIAEGFAIPRLSTLAAAHGVTLDDGSGLYAVGLVVVPLAANVIWVAGLKRGSLQLAVLTGITFAILRYLLVPYTNLAITDFELSFEDIARSFAASPRAYLVLLTTALLATLATRRYGWDVGGILIPGLIAIGWLTPQKSIATLIEVGLVLVVAWPLRSLGLLRGANASRRLIAAFLLLYAGKFLLALTLKSTAPELRATDLFGLGYVLPALLVERVWARGSLARVVGATVALSLAGVALGVGLGYGLDRFAPTAAPRTGPAVIAHVSWNLEAESLRARTRVATTAPSPWAPVIAPADMAGYRLVLRYLAEADNELAAAVAPTIGLAVVELNDGALSLHEAAPSPRSLRGFGTLILLDRATPKTTDLLLEVPHPWDDPLAAAATSEIAQALGARAVIMGGVARDTPRNDPATDVGGPLATASRSLARAAVRLRLMQAPTAHKSGEPLDPTLAAIFAERWQIDLAALPEDESGPHPGGVSILALDKPMLRRIVSATAALPELVAVADVDARLRALCSAREAAADPYDSLRYTVGALMSALDVGCSPPELRYARGQALAAGFDLSRTRLTGDLEALFVEPGQGSMAALLRHCPELGPSPDYVIEVPRATTEPGTLALAFDLLVRLRAKALLVTTTTASDSLTPADRALYKSLITSADARAPTRIVVRGASPDHPLSAELLLSPGAFPLGEAREASRVDILRDTLSRLGVTVEVADARPEHTFAWTVDETLKMTAAPETVIVWATPALRTRAARADQPRPEVISALVATRTGPLEGWAPRLAPTAIADGGATRQELVERAATAIERNDPGALRELLRRARQTGAEIVLWQPTPDSHHLVIGRRSPNLLTLDIVALAQHVGATDYAGRDWSILADYVRGGGRRAALTLDVGRAP